MAKEIPKYDKIMKLSCCIITTNVKNRLILLDDTINSINNLINIFHEKILSIDVFNNIEEIADLNVFNKYYNDWNIYTKNKEPYGSMILNQQNVLNKSNNEIIFYSEDDIIINKIPQLDTIDKLFNYKLINGKFVGFISFNNHVWINFNENPKHIIDYINNPSNYILVNNDLFLIKNNVIKDKYYLNFPVSIFNKNIILFLHKYAMNNCKGLTIEAGLTKAWFDLGYNNDYEVLIYVKNKILDDINAGKKITVLDFYNYANIDFWNNNINLRHPSVVGRSNNVIF